MYLYDCSHEELEKFCRKKYLVDDDDDFQHLKDADGTTFTLDYSKDGFDRIIWLKEFKMTPYNIGVLVHETIHAVVRMLEWKGIPFTSYQNQDEVFAYVTEHLVASFLGKFKK